MHPAFITPTLLPSVHIPTPTRIPHPPSPTLSITPQKRPRPLPTTLAITAAALSTLHPTLPTLAFQPSQPPHLIQTPCNHTPTSHHVSRALPTAIKLKLHPPSPSTASPTTTSHGLAGQSFLVAGSAAFLASATAVAITHPIDTLKTLRQANSTSKPSFPSLYRGIFSNILKEAPNAAIYLGTYELFKSALLGTSFFSQMPLVAMCIAGMLGDAVGSIVRVPAEIVNKRLQLRLNESWNGAIRDAFLSPAGKQGMLAAWQAVLWRDVPYGGLQIAGYEGVVTALAGVGCVGLGWSIVAGAVAGLVAAVVTTPADVLVTRMSTQRPQCYLETKRYMSPVATFFRILREEGVSALWAGAVERGLFYMPMIGIFFAAYESFKRLLGRRAVVVAGAVRAGAAVSAVLGGAFSIRFVVVVLGCLLVGQRRLSSRS